MSDPNPLPLFGDPIGPWHDWFAWRPVRTYDDRRVWLRWLRRRCIQKHQYLYGGDDFWWQYHAGDERPKHDWGTAAHMDREIEKARSPDEGER